MSVLRRAWAPMQARAAAGHVAGPRLVDALAVSRELGRRGIPTTIGYWDRFGEPAPEVAAICMEAIDAIAAGAAAPDCYLSVKVPSLEFDAGLLRGLLAAAAEHAVTVHYDAKAPRTAAATLDLLGAGPPFAPRPGCTLPGGWVRSPADAERVAGLGQRVRVVKGQWLDPGPGRFGARDLRRGFLEVVDRLAGRAGPVAVATHDGALAAEALGRLAAAGTPCELELLYGLGAGRVLRATRKLGVPVRVYVPWGQAYLPYPLWRVPSEPRLAAALAGDLLWRRPGGQVHRYATSLVTSRDTGVPPASIRSAGGEGPRTSGSQSRRSVP